MAQTLTASTSALPAEAVRPRTDSATIAAAGLYVAGAAYEEALRHPDLVATLDNMCDGLAEIAPDIARVLKTEANSEFAEALRAATIAPLWAFTAIERGRAEAGDGYGYLFDLLADSLRGGANPDVVRTTALGAPARIRDLAEHADR
ncbi:hypothetical protein [Streptomyces sp. NPDC052192]|uniref:hypothetical protein n=1 Tax=Streptomyces sp. NPDC052192 TaxID=3155052 RepID=UPI0034215A7D